VDAPLLLGERNGGGRVLLARPIAIAWPIATAIAAPIAAAAVAASPAVLFAFAFRTWPLHLALATSKRVELRPFTRNRRLRLWRLLLGALLLPLLRLTRSAVRTIGTRPAIGAPVVTLALAVALLLLPIASAIATLLEASLLLAIAILIAASIATRAIAALVRAMIAALLVAFLVALLLR